MVPPSLHCKRHHGGQATLCPRLSCLCSTCSTIYQPSDFSRLPSENLSVPPAYIRFECYVKSAWGCMVNGLSLLNACIAPHHLHARRLPHSRGCRPRIKTFPTPPRMTPKRSLRYGHGRRPSHMTREIVAASIRTVRRRRQTFLQPTRLASARGITCGARALSYLLRTAMVVARWRVSPGIQ